MSRHKLSLLKTCKILEKKPNIMSKNESASKQYSTFFKDCNVVYEPFVTKNPPYKFSFKKKTQSYFLQMKAFIQTLD